MSREQAVIKWTFLPVIINGEHDRRDHEVTGIRYRRYQSNIFFFGRIFKRDSAGLRQAQKAQQWVKSKDGATRTRAPSLQTSAVARERFFEGDCP